MKRHALAGKGLKPFFLQLQKALSDSHYARYDFNPKLLHFSKCLHAQLLEEIASPTDTKEFFVYLMSDSETVNVFARAEKDDTRMYDDVEVMITNFIERSHRNFKEPFHTVVVIYESAIYKGQQHYPAMKLFKISSTAQKKIERMMLKKWNKSRTLVKSSNTRVTSQTAKSAAA